MAIEFRCTHCDRLLSTQAGTEGQKAKCPQCGTIQVIPDNSSAAAPEGLGHFDAPPPRDPRLAETQAPPQQTANPYRSPSDYSTDSTDTPLPRGFHPTRIEMGEMLSKTWRIYTSNLGALIVGSLVANIGGNVATAIAWAIGAPLINNNRALIVPVIILEVVAIALVTAFFLIGLMKFMLTIARGGPANFADLVSAGPLTLPAAFVFALLLAGTAAGSVFCLIPGLIFLLIFSQSLFMLLDQRTGVVDSFKYSAAAMSGNLLTFFLLMVVVIIATSLVTLLTCGIGALFAAPFLSLMYAVVYLSVTGQRTAEDPAAHYDRERPFDAPGMQPT
jgi:uncharacterized membrane protein/phage FluMu protein Com